MIKYLLLYTQHDVPPGKHAIITVRQPKGDLIWIQTPTSIDPNKKKPDKEKFVPQLTTWDDCEAIQVRSCYWMPFFFCMMEMALRAKIWHISVVVVEGRLFYYESGIDEKRMYIANENAINKIILEMTGILFCIANEFGRPNVENVIIYIHNIK